MITGYSAMLLLQGYFLLSSSSHGNQIEKCEFEHKGKGIKVNCAYLNFRDVPSGFPVNVSAIDLSGNQIISIKNGSFPLLPLLRELILFYNNITHLEKDSLQNLPSLSQLVLGGNMINFTYSSLPRGLFRNLPLKRLDLSFMLFREENWTFPDETLSDLIHLESFATITPLMPLFGPGFQSLSMLRTLTIQYCQPYGRLSKVDLKIFLKMNITTVSLSGCGEGTIDSDVITVFPKAINVEVKNSHNTGLQNILANFKCFLTSGTRVMKRIALFDVNAIDVTVENVRNNRSLVFTEFMTRYLVQICVHELILDSNRIEIIEKNVLNKLPLSSCLRFLDLSNNEILGDFGFFQTLSTFPRLSAITLGHTSVLSRFRGSTVHNRGLTHQWFSSSAMQIDLPRLSVQKHNLMISQTRKSQIENGNIFTIDLPPELTSLFMTNFLSDIKLSMAIYNTLRFYGGRYLYNLDVSNCSITVADVSVLGLEHVRHLDFSGNGFYELPVNLMKSFPALRILNLNYIQLGMANINRNIESVFGRLQNLKFLTLTHNNLDDLPRDIEKIPNITQIDISYNSISQLSVDTRLSLDTVYELKDRRISLNLQGNTLSCTCGSFDFITWLLETDTMFWNSDTYKCINDNGTIVELNTVLNSYVKYWRACISHFWLSVAICLLLVFLLVFTLCCLIINNLFRLKCMVLRWFGTSFKIPERRDFTYDVFVYYSSKTDYRWVCNTFRQKMETDRGLRLCIPDRDFLPGDCTAEEILDAINNSWKTVIYLTETFLEDELCSFTLSSAVYASTNLMPNRLIILYSDDIFDHPLPRLLTQLLDRDNNFPLDAFDDFEQWNHLYLKVLRWV